MNALEISLFKDRHPALVQEINLISDPDSYGTGSDLDYPRAGRAVLDSPPAGDYYVLVWRDASGRWHFIDLSDRPNLFREINKPPFVSTDASFLDNVLQEMQNVGNTLLLLVGAVVIVSLLRR